ncbi:MAG: VOC family protein [Patescibacteria group bacterium]
MSFDPLGHIKISVSDFAKSRRFYGQFFNFIGYKIVKDKPDGAGWTSPAGFGFWIEPAKVGNHPYKFGAPGWHHFCFKAQSREQVDRLYNEFIIPNNIQVFDAPAAYPQYTPDYYAVFFADPEGMKLEYGHY